MIHIETLKIANAIAKATDNFEEGFEMSTLLGWYGDSYDVEGRPLFVNPNTRRGRIKIDGEYYFIKRRAWEVEIKDNNQKTLIEIDLEPQYIKDYWKNKELENKEK